MSRKVQKQHHGEADERTLSAKAERERGFSPLVVKMGGWVFAGCPLSQVDFGRGVSSANEINRIRLLTNIVTSL